MIATEVRCHMFNSPPTRSASGSFPCLLHAVHQRRRSGSVLISLGFLRTQLPLDSQATARGAVKGFGLSLKEIPTGSHIACHAQSLASVDLPRDTRDQNAVPVASLMTYGQRIHEAGDSLTPTRVSRLASSNGRESDAFHHRISKSPSPVRSAYSR